MRPSLYWYDYETFGTDPKRDRPVQFAGIRTDEALNIISEPSVFYSQCTADTLPHPDACMLTGITPQYSIQYGSKEVDFIRNIQQLLGQPGTCQIGYNNLCFDDEVTRFTLYRNFLDPYQHEWKFDASRWDLLNLMRACYALRPNGIQWPKNSEGYPSFKLEDLTQANNITHTNAHDALQDVYATLSLAQLVRTKQAKLFHYLYQHRSKHAAQKLLTQPLLLHTSGMYPAQYGHTAVITPIAPDPNKKNAMIVYDLRYHPEKLLTLNSDTLREWLFTPSAKRQRHQHIALKKVHSNKAPVLMPIATLRIADAERLQINVTDCQKHLQLLQQAKHLTEKIQAIYQAPEYATNINPELELYQGFFGSQDKHWIQRIQHSDAQALATLDPQFKDTRLPELFFLYRARNYPETLTTTEQQRWQQHCQQRIIDNPDPGYVSLTHYVTLLDQYAQKNLTTLQQNTLHALYKYAEYWQQHYSPTC